MRQNPTIMSNLECSIGYNSLDVVQENAVNTAVSGPDGPGRVHASYRATIGDTVVRLDQQTTWAGELRICGHAMRVDPVFRLRPGASYTGTAVARRTI